METGSKFALIFPAFTNDYPEEAFRVSGSFQKLFYELLGEATRLINPCLERFDPVTNNFLEDEFKTQLVTYVYSCSASEILNSSGIKAGYAAGLSMGIYAALYHSGSISFETGLRLISKAYLESIQCLKSKQYAMCSVIGLSLQDVENIINKFHFQAEITNISSKHSITLSGIFDHIIRFLDAAREEGALHARILKASVPYHTETLRQLEVPFRKMVNDIPVHSPRLQVISLIDQTILASADDIRAELVRNLFTHLQWQRTQETLITMGVETMIECGPGRNLAKNARFIEGSFRFRHFTDFIS